MTDQYDAPPGTGQGRAPAESGRRPGAGAERGGGKSGARGREEQSTGAGRAQQQALMQQLPRRPEQHEFTSNRLNRLAEALAGKGVITLAT